MDATTEAAREEVVVSIRADIAAAAKASNLDMSAISEAALLAATSEARRKAWLEKNADALAQRDAWIDEHGLPLESERLF